MRASAKLPHVNFSSFTLHKHPLSYNAHFISRSRQINQNILVSERVLKTTKVYARAKTSNKLVLGQTKCNRNATRGKQPRALADII